MKKIFLLVALVAMTGLGQVCAQTSWKIGADSAITAVFTPADSTLRFSGAGRISDDYYDDSFYSSWSKSNMDRVTHVIIGDSITRVGRMLFYDATSIRDVVIGSAVDTIAYSAFNFCESLSSMQNRSNHLLLENGSFKNCNFSGTLDLTGVTCMKADAFQGNTGIETVLLPDMKGQYYMLFGTEMKNLKRIVMPQMDSLMSYGLHSLNIEHVEAPNLRYIAERAFYNCKSLQEFTLPATLEEISTNAFYGSERLQKLTVNAPNDATINGYGYIFPCDVDTIVANTTFVPSCYHSYTLVLYANEEIKEAYRAAGYYFEDYDTSYTHRLTEPTTLSAADAATYANSSLLLDHSDAFGAVGSLTIDAGASIHLGRFCKHDFNGMEITWNSWNNEMRYNPEEPSISFNRYYSSLQPALLVNGSMTADTVLLRQDYKDRNWYFTSLPFDIKVNDIEMPEGVFYAIRHFDPVAQAQGNENAAWVDYQPTDVIPAGTGFIINFFDARAEQNNFIRLEYMAPAAQVNNIFKNNDQALTLTHQTGVQPWFSDWNLLANPYPSFYNARDIASNGVIGVYGGAGGKSYGYSFYSLTDDYYVLQPGESFFYQARANEQNLNFPLIGRRLTARPDSVTLDDAMYSPARAMRTIVNIRASRGEASDRCRIVFNEAASQDYEAGIDAPKMTIGNEPILLSSTMGAARLAINERPAGNGSVLLNLQVREAGDYTLALEETQTQATLIDLVIGTETDLSNGSYTCHLAAGDHANRFELHLGARQMPTDLDSIETDEAAAEVYTVTGLKVTDRTMPGIQIIRRGGKVTKVLNY